MNHKGFPFDIYKTLAEFSADWLTYRAADGKTLYVSESVKEITGYDRKNFLSNSDFFFEIIHPGDRERISKEFDLEMKKLHPCTRFFRIVHKNGEIKWISHRCRPVFDDRGNIIGRVSSNRDITKEKQTEKNLRESESRYRSILNALPDIVFVIDDNLVFTDCYAPDKSTLLKPREEIIGQHVHAVLPGFLAKLAGEKVMKTLESGLLQFFEYDLEISGGTRWFEARMVPKDKHEVLVVIRDTTKRKEAEHALRESEQRYRRLFENSMDAIFFNTFDGFIFDMNPAGLQMFGFSSLDEVKSINILSLYKNPNDRKKFLSLLMAQGFVKDYEITFRRLDGSEFTAQTTSAVIYGEDKRPVAIQGILRDVTEKNAKEENIHRLATVVEQASQSIIITDLNGDIIYVNPAFEKTTGYAFSEVKGQNPRILQSDRHDKEFYEDLWRTIISGETWHGIFTNKKKDGTIFYERAALFPIKNAAGRIINFAAVKQDITKEKMLAAQLVQAQKMETVGQLASGISHDFNNLLSIIKGYCEVGLLKISKDAPGHRELSAIHEAGTRAEALVNQLMAFSRKQVHAPRPTDINRTIASLEKMIRRTISEDIHFETILTPDLPLVKADPSQIEQILLNLIINARDAINAKTDKRSKREIILETAFATLDENYISRHYEIIPGRYILISVSDTGIGMDENVRERVFEPFFSTKEQGKGTGLGLSTVYGIVKQNQGYIYIYSEPGEGTTCKIYWPVTEETLQPDTEAPAKKILIRGREKILFVEDEDELRKLAVGVLREHGYRVTEAANGIEALHHLEKSETPFDLMITDVIMPLMNGDELAREAVGVQPGIKIIFTSGYANNHIFQNGILDKGIQFLQKPYSLVDLFSKIRETVGPKKKDSG